MFTAYRPKERNLLYVVLSFNLGERIYSAMVEALHFVSLCIF